MRFKEGIPVPYLLYGYKWNGRDYDIIPEQAEVVEEIYSSYLDGRSPNQIASSLEERNIPSTRGGKFTYSLVWNILRCEKYTGDSILQKTYCKDFINGKRRKNNGEAPRYLAEGTHPVIISKETFDKVQEEIERRRELGYKANQSLRFSCFSSKVISTAMVAPIVREWPRTPEELLSTTAGSAALRLSIPHPAVMLRMCQIGFCIL